VRALSILAERARPAGIAPFRRIKKAGAAGFFILAKGFI
jgi:hypothetical protein